MDMYKCKCCGGHIDRVTMTCEYCGTRYKEENNHIIKIETFQNPVETFSAQIVMDDELMRYSVDDASRIAIEQLSRELTKCVAPMMVVDHYYDPLYMQHKIRGTVKIVRPTSRTTLGEAIESGNLFGR